MHRKRIIPRIPVAELAIGALLLILAVGLLVGISWVASPAAGARDAARVVPVTALSDWAHSARLHLLPDCRTEDSGDCWLTEPWHTINHQCHVRALRCAPVPQAVAEAMALGDRKAVMVVWANVTVVFVRDSNGVDAFSS